jgi:hypothetical protein
VHNNKVSLGNPAPRQFWMELEGPMNKLYVRTMFERGECIFQAMFGQPAEGTNDVAPEFDFHIRLFSFPFSTARLPVVFRKSIIVT